jgi:hypothetical protein
MLFCQNQQCHVQPSNISLQKWLFLDTQYSLCLGSLNPVLHFHHVRPFCCMCIKRLFNLLKCCNFVSCLLHLCIIFLVGGSPKCLTGAVLLRSSFMWFLIFILKPTVQGILICSLHIQSFSINFPGKTVCFVVWKMWYLCFIAAVQCTSERV